jgi:hypothetical protein
MATQSISAVEVKHAKRKQFACMQDSFYTHYGVFPDSRNAGRFCLTAMHTIDQARWTKGNRQKCPAQRDLGTSLQDLQRCTKEASAVCIFRAACAVMCQLGNRAVVRRLEMRWPLAQTTPTRKRGSFLRPFSMISITLDRKRCFPCG